MLMRYADRRGFTVGAAATVKGAHRFSVSGSNPYRVLKFEQGIHRAHHVPDSEPLGRIHTSTAVVRLVDRDSDAPAQAESVQPERVRTYDYPQGHSKTIGSVWSSPTYQPSSMAAWKTSRLRSKPTKIRSDSRPRGPRPRASHRRRLLVQDRCDSAGYCFATGICSLLAARVTLRSNDTTTEPVCLAVASR